MKNLRTVLSVLTGVLFASGYFVMGANGSKPQLVVVGVIFGGSMTFRMLREPEKVVAPANLVIFGVLLLALDVFIAFKEPSNLPGTLVWTLALAASIFTFARLHAREQRTNPSDTSSGA